MNHTNTLTKYVANFIDELVKCGVHHVIISPGSRSTPLAMIAAEHPGIKEWVLVDERSAAFFGLGIAKETNHPVALICTSGTAAANYYPAIIEAKYSRVPLVILTADRPHELRDVGASQTINQLNMYGDFVKYYQEMALPEASEAMINYVRSRASRAVHEANKDNKGPVHLNFPFREPLIPNLSLQVLWDVDATEQHHYSYEGQKQLSEIDLNHFLNKIKDKKHGLIVCGPQTDEYLAKQIVKLAVTWQIPVLADPLSQVRSVQNEEAVIIDGYDALFKNEIIREQLKPDYIIRFGAMPVSKSYLFFVEQHKDILKFVIENESAAREPTNLKTDFIFADGVTFCREIIQKSADKGKAKDWLLLWERRNEIVKKHISNISSENLTEGETVQHVVQNLPLSSRLFIGNSMAVRDLDTFFMTTNRQIYVHANRGVSGIDGIVSTALGVAATSKQRVTLMIGDLAFYHDLNGLLASVHYGIDLTIVLINNDGGGVFSFLPQAKERKHFENLFGTPLQIEFKQGVEMYGGTYQLVTKRNDLISGLKNSYQTKGLTVLEVKTDREENVKWHRGLWDYIEKELLHED